MEVGCELCEKKAMIDCDSDQAKLCWDCDRKVHSANFLVANHTRVLLCRLCNSPTPWKASGPTLPPTLSLCHACHMANRDSVNDEDSGEYSSDEDSDHTYDDDDEGENQVVPASSASSLDADALAGKPLPDNTKDEIGSSSESLSAAALPSSEESTSMSVFRPLNQRNN